MTIRRRFAFFYVVASLLGVGFVVVGLIATTPSATLYERTSLVSNLAGITILCAFVSPIVSWGFSSHLRSIRWWEVIAFGLYAPVVGLILMALAAPVLGLIAMAVTFDPAMFSFFIASAGVAFIGYVLAFFFVTVYGVAYMLILRLVALRLNVFECKDFVRTDVLT